MRKLLPALLLCSLVGACARPPEYVGPAPAGALQCALREAEELGYRRIEGKPEERFTRVAQRLEPPPAEQADPRDPVLGEDKVLPKNKKQDRPLENQLLLREERGRLHIQVVSIVEREDMVQPTSGADDHAQLILAECTS